MAEIILIRHSMTRGNLEGRYIGCRTDEPLCEEGIRLLAGRVYPAVDRIYVSPMRRCVETAQAIWGSGFPAACHGSVVQTFGDGFPAVRHGSVVRTFEENTDSEGRPVPMILISALQECDFGEFENKNYQELNGDPAYQAWIDSNGSLPFPGGESAEAFKRRCQEGFEIIAGSVRKLSLRAAVVAHGGTIMAVLERFGYPKKDYFDYQVKNGCGYVLTPVEGTDLWNYQCLP